MPASDDLLYQYVLVNPSLQNDPANKQNWPGLIIKVDIDQDDFIVSFQDNTNGRYSSDALLKLKPREEIHQLLVDHGDFLAFADLKTLTQMDLFLRYGENDMEWKVLLLAAENPAIQQLSFDCLKDMLAVRQSQSLKR